MAFACDSEQNNEFQLFNVDLKTNDRVKLSPTLPSGSTVITDFLQFDPKGKTLTFLSTHESPDTVEAFRTDLKTGSLIKLNDSLVTDGDVDFIRVQGSPLPYID